MSKGKRLFQHYSTDLAALLVVTIWGISFVFRKAALEQFDALPFISLRFLGMVVLGWGVFLWRGRTNKDRMSVTRSDLRSLVLAGVLGYTLYIPISTIGLSYTTAFSNALLIATAPLFAALLLWALRVEPVGLRQSLGMLISFLGVIIFFLEKAHIGLNTASIGNLISLAAALFFAAYTVANKPLLSRYPVILVMTYTLTIGAVPVVLLTLPAMFTQDWGRISLVGWSVLAWAIIVPVYVAWTIWNWVIARVGVARTSVFMYLVPIIGGIASWLLLGERFGVLKMVGTMVTLGGLTLARRVVTPKPTAEDARELESAFTSSGDFRTK